MRFSATSETGHDVEMDGPIEYGGQNVVTILRKGRQEITDCSVEISALRTVDDPKVFTDIHLQFMVTGHELSPSKVKRAIDLSARQYCSASIMMQRGGVRFTHDYETKETP